MNAEDRLTRLENTLLKLSGQQNTGPDSLKFYRYELFVPYVQPPQGDLRMNILLQFDTTLDYMPLVVLHKTQGVQTTSLHPTGGSSITTKRYLTSQSQDATYILISTQPGSFYRV